MSFRETEFLSTFRRDPQHLAFWASRYKFVSRILAGEKRVIEVGCGNGFMGAMVAQTVQLLIQTDIAPLRGSGIEQWNPADGKYRKGKFTAAYALDVLEHIAPRDEDDFLDHITESLTDTGTCIIGMPSLESQPYASAASRAAHVNCKSESQLRETLQRHYVKVFLFSMNDESIGTGFGPMAHYRIALCTHPR
jgi:hypothetical protein